MIIGMTLIVLVELLVDDSFQLEPSRAKIDGQSNFQFLHELGRTDVFHFNHHLHFRGKAPSWHGR